MCNISFKMNQHSEEYFFENKCSKCTECSVCSLKGVTICGSCQKCKNICIFNFNQIKRNWYNFWSHHIKLDIASLNSEYPFLRFEYIGNRETLITLRDYYFDEENSESEFFEVELVITMNKTSQGNCLKEEPIRWTLLFVNDGKGNSTKKDIIRLVYTILGLSKNGLVAITLTLENFSYFVDLLNLSTLFNFLFIFDVLTAGLSHFIWVTNVSVITEQRNYLTRLLWRVNSAEERLMLYSYISSNYSRVGFFDIIESIHVVLAVIMTLVLIGYKIRLSLDKLFKLIAKHGRYSLEASKKNFEKEILKKKGKKYFERFLFWKRYPKLISILQKTINRIHKRRYYVLGNLLIASVVPVSISLFQGVSLVVRFPKIFLLRFSIFCFVITYIYTFIIFKLVKRMLYLETFNRLTKDFIDQIMISKKAVIQGCYLIVFIGVCSFMNPQNFFFIDTLVLIQVVFIYVKNKKFLKDENSVLLTLPDCAFSCL